jgi:hypothetical protein
MRSLNRDALFAARPQTNKKRGGGQTNNQAAQAIAQGKNPGGINQGQAGEGAI